MKVTPMVGRYEVLIAGPKGNQQFFVSKEGACSCGRNSRKPCVHIDAVKLHIRMGGSKALSAADIDPMACPECNGPIRWEGRLWICLADSSHYFWWKGRGAVEAFLTKPHPNKVGPYYEMTLQERDEFLETMQERMDDLLRLESGRER